MDVPFSMVSLPYFKNSDGFSCVVTAHLISSGWISICCHCCFTNQWMWFSICLDCFLSKSREYCFQCVITAHLISIGCISINVVNAVSLNSEYGFLDVSKSIGYGFHVFTAYLITSEWILILCYVAVFIYYVIILFHLLEYKIFHMFSLFSFKKTADVVFQWIK